MADARRESAAILSYCKGEQHSRHHLSVEFNSIEDFSETPYKVIIAEKGRKRKRKEKSFVQDRLRLKQRTSPMQTQGEVRISEKSDEYVFQHENDGEHIHQHADFLRLEFAGNEVDHNIGDNA